jgi:hypothetical protein
MRNVFDRTAAERGRVQIANQEHARAEALFNDLASIPKDDGDYAQAVAELPAATSAVRVTGAECVEANVALNASIETARRTILAERTVERRKLIKKYVAALEAAKRDGDVLARFDQDTCALLDISGTGAYVDQVVWSAMERLEDWQLWLKNQGLI